jgi:hypothetical protein
MINIRGTPVASTSRGRPNKALEQVLVRGGCAPCFLLLLNLYYRTADPCILHFDFANCRLQDRHHYYKLSLQSMKN